MQRGRVGWGSGFNEYSEYGYRVAPRGEAVVVPNSSHYKVRVRHYTCDARIGPDHYGGVISEGWCWVSVSGSFICFLDPNAVTRQAAGTMLRIVQEYSDFSDYRIVLIDPGEHIGREKHDFTDTTAARDFIRGLAN